MPVVRCASRSPVSSFDEQGGLAVNLCLSSRPPPKRFPGLLASRQEHSPGSFIQKWVHFLPFMNRFGNFSFYSEATESRLFFSVKFRDLLFSFGNFPYIFILVQYISKVMYTVGA